jgi:hypothetical protein
MKKSIVCIAACLIASLAFAQSDRYENAMKANIVLVDSMMAKGNALELAHNFERIADVEKTQWLPYYYAAYCTVVNAYTEKDNNQKDQIADQATELINKADSLLGKENSETDVIKSMIATAHMMVDPQSRYMTYGQEAGEYIQKSEALDSTNPRPVLLQAQNKFYTPEQFGGGKDAAREFFDKADSLDRNFKPETDLSPNWGRSSIQYFLFQYK